MAQKDVEAQIWPCGFCFGPHSSRGEAIWWELVGMSLFHPFHQAGLADPGTSSSDEAQGLLCGSSFLLRAGCAARSARGLLLLYTMMENKCLALTVGSFSLLGWRDLGKTWNILVHLVWTDVC